MENSGTVIATLIFGVIVPIAAGLYPSSKHLFVRFVVACFLGCWFNNLTIDEILIRPGGAQVAGDLMTLLQFIVVTLLSAPAFLSQSVRLPWRMVAASSILFCVQNVMNNRAYKYRVSVSIHTTFRSASLLVSLAIGYLFFNKRYTPMQLLVVVVVTLGVLYVTVLGLPSHAAKDSPGDVAEPFSSDVMWGIAYMALSMLLQGAVGHVQSKTLQQAPPSQAAAASSLLMTWMHAVSSVALLGSEAVAVVVALAARTAAPAGCTGMTMESGALAVDAMGELPTPSHIPPASPFDADHHVHAAAVAAGGGGVAAPQLWWAASPAAAAAVTAAASPSLATWTALNALTQYAAMVGVLGMFASGSHLAASLTLTIRKLSTVVISMLLYHPGSWAPDVWTAAVAVFAAAGGYPLLPSSSAAAPAAQHGGVSPLTPEAQRLRPRGRRPKERAPAAAAERRLRREARHAQLPLPPADAQHNGVSGQAAPKERHPKPPKARSRVASSAAAAGPSGGRGSDDSGIAPTATGTACGGDGIACGGTRRGWVGERDGNRTASVQRRLLTPAGAHAGDGGASDASSYNGGSSDGDSVSTVEHARGSAPTARALWRPSTTRRSETRPRTASSG